ncbi:YtxH domain-containing protein [Agromyces binzhouensis]|uniref:YtxH domain-containing protein n=1 Tax=Agromyces binzhouensis TaxID=1817495 RepID=UPI001A914CF9|nr:YtxH domain-containing protein [Agromyces binzhouensis]
MKGKILFVVGLGVGYVLGTRAGRERYEQIQKAAENVWNQPTVQEGVQTVKDFAMARVGDVSDAVLDKAKKVVRQISEGSSTTGTPAKSSGGAKSTAAKSTGSKSTGAKSTSSKSTGTKSTSAKSSGAKSSGSSSSTRASSAKSDASDSKASGSSGSSSSSS